MFVVLFKGMVGGNAPSKRNRLHACVCVSSYNCTRLRSANLLKSRVTTKASYQSG